jgi:glycosyltransferase
MLKISIITVVRNGAATLCDCIESVQQQSYPYENREHIIVDGASGDGTLQLIEKYRSSFSRVISEADNGIYDAMNKGIALASGDVIGILNADDVYAHKNVLAKVAAVFDDDRMDSCYGDLNYVDRLQPSKITRRWRSGPYARSSFYQGWMPPHPTFFLRKRMYDMYGDFNPELGTAADYELMLRLLLHHNITTAWIPEVLVHMRSGGMSNMSLKNRITANRMDRRAWRENGLTPRLWTLWIKPLRKIGQYISSLGILGTP